MKRAADPLPGIAARHPGYCAICDEPYDRNDRIVARRGKWCHVACYQRENE